jgi:hypothetical protein
MVIGSTIFCHKNTNKATQESPDYESDKSYTDRHEIKPVYWKEELEEEQILILITS